MEGLWRSYDRKFELLAAKGMPAPGTQTTYEAFPNVFFNRPPDLADGVVSNVEGIVQARLDELTPKMVKEIVQEMIRQHLGWLVVWGGVFGGLMGVIAHFLA